MRLYIYMLKSRLATKALIMAIRAWDKVAILQILEFYPHPHVDVKYIDEVTGNDLMHMAIESAQSHWTTNDDFREVITRLNTIGVRSDRRNRAEKLPWECATTRPALGDQLQRLDSYARIKQREAEIIEKSAGYLYRDTSTSRVYPGVYLVDNLNLEFSSKNPLKRCDILDRSTEIDPFDGGALSLHERLAMAAAFRSKGDVSINNYVTINIGFVVSTAVHESTPRDERRRKFVTVPILDPDFAIFWQEGKVSQVHSEAILYQYLSQTQNLDSIISELQARGILDGFKIYALVLDIHTQNKMCRDCTRETFENQLGDSFIQLLEKKLAIHYVLPKIKAPCPDLFSPPQEKRLHVVTRVSHGKFCGDDSTVPFSLKHSEHIPIHTVLAEKDIKKFGSAVMLKDVRTERYGGFWDKKCSVDAEKGKPVVFVNQTAFINYNKEAARDRRQQAIAYEPDASPITRPIISSFI